MEQEDLVDPWSIFGPANDIPALPPCTPLWLGTCGLTGNPHHPSRHLIGQSSLYKPPRAADPTISNSMLRETNTIKKKNNSRGVKRSQSLPGQITKRLWTCI